MSQQTIQKQKNIYIDKMISILRACKAPQIAGAYFDGKGGMCAMGAIKVGFGTSNEYGGMWYGESPVYKEYFQAMGELTGNGIDTIIHMNDRLGMSFSEIADALEKMY